MENILAGETLTANALNNWTPGTLSDTCTPATNFTVASFTVNWIAGVTFFSVLLTYSGSTITASSTGTITPTLCCTLPFAPAATAWFPYDFNNTADGLLACTTAGACTLYTLSPTATITSGHNIGFSGIILTG